MPRRLTVMVGVGLVVTVTLGIVLLVRGLTAFGLFLLIGPPLFTVANVVLIRNSLRLQRPGAPRRRGGPTGRVLAPVPMSPAEWKAPDRDLSWTGGGNVAGDLGRMNATWPLAVLQLSQGVVSLRFRPASLIGGMFGATPSSWPAGEVLAVYPVRGRLARIQRGVAIESTSRPLAYFWTWQPESVLAALSRQGFPVDWAERHIRLRA